MSLSISNIILKNLVLKEDSLHGGINLDVYKDIIKNALKNNVDIINKVLTESNTSDILVQYQSQRKKLREKLYNENIKKKFDKKDYVEEINQYLETQFPIWYDRDLKNLIQTQNDLLNGRKFQQINDFLNVDLRKKIFSITENFYSELRNFDQMWHFNEERLELTKNIEEEMKKIYDKNPGLHEKIKKISFRKGYLNEIIKFSDNEEEKKNIYISENKYGKIIFNFMTFFETEYARKLHNYTLDNKLFNILQFYWNEETLKEDFLKYHFIADTSFVTHLKNIESKVEKYNALKNDLKECNKKFSECKTNLKTVFQMDTPTFENIKQKYEEKKSSKKE